jgi:hypothetical protein
MQSFGTHLESHPSYCHRRDIGSQRNRNLCHSIARHCATKVICIFALRKDNPETCISIHLLHCASTIHCANPKFIPLRIPLLNSPVWGLMGELWIHDLVNWASQKNTIQDWDNCGYSWHLLHFPTVMLCPGMLDYIVDNVLARSMICHLASNTTFASMLHYATLRGLYVLACTQCKN